VTWTATVAGGTGAMICFGACGLSSTGESTDLDATGDVGRPEVGSWQDGGNVDEGRPDVTVDDAADVGVADVVADSAVADTAADADGGQDATEAAAPRCNSVNCGGACCGDICLPTSCATCDAGHIFCSNFPPSPYSNGHCVSSCDTCGTGATSLPVTCWSCAPKVAGSCAAAASDCPADRDAGVCTCASGSAGDCPGGNQVCANVAANNVCLTCGQIANGTDTNGLRCAGGQGCDQPSATCSKP
jgi:hypothetical protein